MNLNNDILIYNCIAICSKQIFYMIGVFITINLIA